MLFDIFKRTLNTGITITGALIAILLSIFGYLPVNPVVSRQPSTFSTAAFGRLRKP